ncbi:hypothetical protein SKAU_G00088820 [Synaphobranchus kaupii]|uniref:Uncharacterized protein n=1 Tax=Synaphobranchus kaupii TaxID=118154 RepID=A0A9Q1J5X8_SYNKA|nr:hypothetical protein SKAU_G00088820 [Synaphobranchus kaupii]
MEIAEGAAQEVATGQSPDVWQEGHKLWALAAHGSRPARKRGSPRKFLLGGAASF